MEFTYRPALGLPDLTRVELAVADLDPAVLLDIDPLGQAVRISTTVSEDELLACLRRAGIQATPMEIERLPSVCCGGCGG